MQVPRRYLLLALYHLGCCVAVGVGFVTILPVAIPAALWLLIAGSTIHEFQPDIARWWKARRAGKSGGTAIDAEVTTTAAYDVLQYWHQTVWEVLFQQAPYPKLVRMRDTGQVVELKHPNPDYGRRED